MRFPCTALEIFCKFELYQNEWVFFKKKKRKVTFKVTRPSILSSAINVTDNTQNLQLEFRVQMQTAVYFCFNLKSYVHKHNKKKLFLADSHAKTFVEGAKELRGLLKASMQEAPQQSLGPERADPAWKSTSVGTWNIHRSLNLPESSSGKERQNIQPSKIK